MCYFEGNPFFEVTKQLMIDYFLQNSKLYDSFSKSLKIVSRYLNESPEAFIAQSAAQIGKNIGVSETTVIRFSQALGFSTYKELQKAIQFNFLKQRSTFHNYQIATEKWQNEDRVCQSVMKEDMANIERTMKAIHPHLFQKSVDKLSKADNILVAGVRASFSMAHWFSFMLNLMTGKATLNRPQTDDVLLDLSRMNNKSVCVIFSFHRYATEQIKFAAEVKERGAYIIVITDSPKAPANQYADAAFVIEMNHPSTPMIAPAVYSLINAFLTALTIKDPENMERRKKQYDQLQSRSFFVPKELYTDEN